LFREDLFQHYLARLRSRGSRITEARKTVLRVLCSGEHHMTSARVVERVQETDPSIGRASVFRVLELLTDLEVLRPVYLSSQGASYCLMEQDGHHAHIICPRCRRITEISECFFGDAERSIAEKYQREITGHVIELYGLCENCRKSE